MEKLLVWFWKWITYLAARTIYGPISRLWRKLFERKYKRLPDSFPWTTRQLLTFYTTCTWVSDALGGVLDIISKPEKFYETRKGDCDEFAVFGAYALQWPSYILSITWLDPKAKWFKKFKGHNVCAYYYDSKWWHIGNWGKRGPFDSLQDTVYNVIPKNCKPCAFSVRYKDTLKWIAGGRLKER